MKPLARLKAAAGQFLIDSHSTLCEAAGINGRSPHRSLSCALGPRGNLEQARTQAEDRSLGCTTGLEDCPGNAAIFELLATQGLTRRIILTSSNRSMKTGDSVGPLREHQAVEID
jgi:hypothetical protein